ncbi:MAG TPA: hypothetical protein VGF04_09670, partial [Solirubrobacterales bacterium]
VPNTFVITAADADRLVAQARSIGAATLVRTIDELSAALTAVREGDDARMAVEIALLKAARPDLDPSAEGLLRRVERLESRVDKGPRAAGPVAAPPATDTENQDEKASAAPIEPEPAPTDDAAEESVGEHSGHELGLDEVKRVWPAVVDQLLKTAPALAASFEGARPVAVDAEQGTLTVGFPADHTFNKRKAEAPDKREQLAKAVEGVLGRALRPAYVVLDGPDEEAEEQPKGELDHDALVAKLKSEFDAEEVG